MKAILRDDDFKLAYLEVTKNLIFETDASKIALAGVLYQDAHHGPSLNDIIYCYSKTLKPAEMRFSITCRETIAILMFARKWSEFSGDEGLRYKLIIHNSKDYLERI